MTEPLRDGDYYISTPTKVRVFCEGDHWAIDGADDDGRYTEAVWTYWDGVEFDTMEHALARAAAFAAENGWGNLPIVIVPDDPPVPSEPTLAERAIAEYQAGVDAQEAAWRVQDYQARVHTVRQAVSAVVVALGVNVDGVWVPANDPRTAWLYVDGVWLVYGGESMSGTRGLTVCSMCPVHDEPQSTTNAANTVEQLGMSLVAISRAGVQCLYQSNPHPIEDIRQPQNEWTFDGDDAPHPTHPKEND